MKRLILLLALAGPMMVKARQAYKISGEVKNMAVQKVFLTYSRGIPNEPLVNDSATVVNGRYVFTGKIQGMTFARIHGKEISSGMAIVILSPEQFTVVHDCEFGFMVITGSRTNDDFKAMNALEADYRKKIGLSANQAEKEVLIAEVQEKAYRDYVRNSPESPLALYALKRYAVKGHKLDLERARPLFDLLPLRVRQSYEGVELAKQMEYTEVFSANSSVGSVAKEFSLKDTSGRVVRLSDYKGKYVLVDFWASWCSPCRADNPHLKDAYAKYHHNGFDILSVSLDLKAAKAKWLKAINDDGIGAWAHVADLDNPVNTAVKLYGVQGIPQNFLIDPSGKIIASGLRNGALETELSKALEK